jgi:hypothetical protein
VKTLKPSRTAQAIAVRGGQHLAGLRREGVNLARLAGQLRDL